MLQELKIRKNRQGCAGAGKAQLLPEQLCSRRFSSSLLRGEQLPDSLVHPVNGMIQLLIFLLKLMKAHIHGEKHMAIGAGTGEAKAVRLGSGVGGNLSGFRQNVVQNQNIAFFRRKTHEFRAGNR